MLVIKRKPGQTVWVGAMAITVVQVDRGTVKLGFAGPREVRVERDEIRGTVRGDEREDGGC